MSQKHYFMEKRTFKLRGSLYVDLFVLADTLEEAREIAQEKIDKISLAIPNSYVGGVATPEEIMEDPDRI